MYKFILWLLWPVVFNFFFVGCAKNESSITIKQELEEVTSQLDDAWNKGDATAFSKLWIENTTNISPMGKIDDGREALEKNMAVQFSGRMKGTTHKLIIERTYLLSNSVAMADGISEIVMNNYEPWRSKFTAVFLKENNNWKIAHMRAYVFLK